MVPIPEAAVRCVPALARLRTDGHLVALDAAVVGTAHLVALVLRFDGRVPADYWERFPVFVLLAVLVHLALLVRLGLYGRVWRQAGPAEAWNLASAASSATAVLMLLTYASGWAGAERLVPLSVPLTGGAFAVLLLGGVRFRARVLAGRAARAATVGEDGPRVVLVGPVEDARAVLTQMRAAPEIGLRPVALLTEDRWAWHRSLDGIPVAGPVSRVLEVAEQHDGDQLLLMPSRDDGADVAAMTELIQGTSLRLRILPTLRERVHAPTPRLRDIRDVRIEDLLGRDPVEIEDPRVRAILCGRRVLVTGAGGSIGSEIAAQVASFEPAALVLLDHDETHLHDVVARLGAACRPVLGDIRDDVFVTRLFEVERPEIVFHAAAHKHVPILESFPSEAARTNVLGTDCLLRAAVRFDTERFVSISTDKAVDPVSVMGCSKRVAELLLVHHHRVAQGRFCAVRFGNVLGSRGSVVPTFVRQMAEGGPVTVTHPDMERYFMTTREAVHLVMQAAAGSTGGEVYTLDMGRPVRIVELAERLITLSGKVPGVDVAIRFTGLRPGEKLSEVLHGQTEDVRPTAHPKVQLVRGCDVPGGPLLHGVARLAALANRRDEAEVRQVLVELSRLPDTLPDTLPATRPDSLPGPSRAVVPLVRDAVGPVPAAGQA